MVFGTGHLTWEWSPHAQLRSAVHPSIFALFYWIAKQLGLDSRFVVAHLPRVLQAMLAAVGDLYVYKWSLKLFRSKPIAFWSLFCSCVSFFNFFCITRTFSNSAETVLTIVALYYWPTSFTAVPRSTKKNDNDPLQLYNKPYLNSDSWMFALSFAAVAVMLRPTSVLVWLPLGVRSLWLYDNLASRLTLCVCVLCVAFVTVVVWLCIDYYFYNEITFVLWNFITFNVVNGLDKLYGSHPWHWYLSQGGWVVFGTQLPLCVCGMVLVLTSSLSSSKTSSSTTTTSSTTSKTSGATQSRRQLQTMTVSMVLVVAVVVAALSCTAHKEFRFILPLLPIVNVWSGFGLDCIRVAMTEAKDNSRNNKNTNKVRSLRARQGVRDAPLFMYCQSTCGKSHRLFQLFLFLLVLINVVVAAILSLIHQRGTIDVINYLATVEDTASHPVTAIHFWTPCHATPYTSYLHRRSSVVRTKQLDCSPPTMRSNWCGGTVCNALKSEVFPNHGLSQSTSFETFPLETLDYLYKDMMRGGEKKKDKDEEEKNAPEFDRLGKIVVQWNWMHARGSFLPPSHVVLFDSEETVKVVDFLKNQMKCVRVVDFFHSFAQGDMDANRMRSRIALWRCGGT